MLEAVDDTDESLMLRYASGDAAAFARLYDRHERPVHRYFLRQGIAAAQADDLLQETWLAVVRSAARYTVEARFTTWLYRIARSKLVDHWRATRHTALMDDAANDPDDEAGAAIERVAADDSARPDVQALTRERAEALVGAIEALPPAQREALLLHLDGGMTIDEIAATTDVGFETAKSRLRYAVRRVRAACAHWLATPLADEA
jgi:RNA polymerase sigma factor (sigma-70 family)